MSERESKTHNKTEQGNRASSAILFSLPSVGLIDCGGWMGAIACPSTLDEENLLLGNTHSWGKLFP